MGIGAIASGVVAAAGLASSLFAAQSQRNAQKKALAAQRDAAKHDIQIARTDAPPTQTQADMAETNTAARLSEAKRRQGLASTLRPTTLVSSLASGRKTLGG